MPVLLLVDGSSFLYRAFYAMNDLHSSNGKPTGAIYGFLSMLEKLEKDIAHDFIAVVLDAKGKNFRHALFENYKANRAKMPDDLIFQKQAIVQALSYLGFPTFLQENVEADDVLATFASHAANQHYDVVIASSDKDLMQLVSPQIRVFDSAKNQLLNADAVLQKFGVSPEKMVDYLVLVGDSSDNIPGVAKCGPKTAAKWLNEYGNLAGIIENAHKIKGVVGENLRQHLDFFPTALKLVQLKKDVPHLPPIEHLKRQNIDLDSFQTFCQNFELFSFLKNNSNENKTPKNYLNIPAEKFPQFLEKLNQAENLSFYFNENPLQMAFCFEKNNALTVDFLFDLIDEHFQKFFQNFKGNLIVSDVYETLKFFKKYNLNFNQKIKDVEIMSFILNAGKYNAHHLNALIQRYFVESDSFLSSEKADFILQLFYRFENDFKQNTKQKELFENLEMPLSFVLFEMQENGVLLNTELLKKQSEEMAEQLKIFENEIFKIAEQSFNINSPQQLSDILFVKLNLPHGKKTKSGIYSTNEEVLSDLSWHPLPDLILKYRTLAKLKNTYTDKLPQMVDFNFRIHTHFKQTGAVTGRLSSAEPNLQNIPIRTLEGKKIRQAFIAPMGKQILSADYSQIELRIMAHLSGDLNLIRAFQNKADIHKISAAQIFKIPLASVDENQRRIAKSINFGLIYGMSSFGLSKQLNITVMEAENYMGRYFNQYPQILEYMEKTRECAIKNGYVETIFGRRLYLPDLYSENMHKKKAAERAAINAPLQGSAADLIKRAMIKIAQDLKETNNPSLLILQVHDELILEVPVDVLEETKNLIRLNMCSAAKLNVPLEVSILASQNWANAH